MSVATCSGAVSTEITCMENLVQRVSLVIHCIRNFFNSFVMASKKEVASVPLVVYEMVRTMLLRSVVCSCIK